MRLKYVINNMYFSNYSYTWVIISCWSIFLYCCFVTNWFTIDILKQITIKNNVYDGYLIKQILH